MTAEKKANIAGFSAIILWSSFALLISYCENVPPLLLISCFSFIAFAVFFIKWLIYRESIPAHFGLPFGVVLFATAGLGLYHGLYILSFSLAPAIEVSLINYLWPTMLVLFGAVLPGHRLRWRHVAGVLVGLIGTYILVLGLELPQNTFTRPGAGHLLAFSAALVWAVYSVLTRTTQQFSSNVIPIAFLFCGFIFLGLNLIFESVHRVPFHSLPFLLFLGMGSGASYFLWDQGMKHGNIPLIGVCAYFTPVLSTLLLILFDKADMTFQIVLATSLILCASFIASKNKLSPSAP